MTKLHRRVRYKGTHPRKFQEKYKELNPDKYKSDIEKIKARGATPAGTHRPICVNEILEILKPRAGETALDATLGYGGHAVKILEKILPGGKLIALDQDPIEAPKTEARLRTQFSKNKNALVVGDANFKDAKIFLDSMGINEVDMVLADLGVSSMQIDDPSRGFSFKIDGPLDLRMNPNIGVPAHVFLSRLSQKDLVHILKENADERHAEIIAKALLMAKPKTTIQMTETIEKVIAAKFTTREKKEEGEKPIRRAFQALRIAVNDEFVVLDEFLEDIPNILKTWGRVAILTFHSGEDRRVKKSFQAFLRAGVYSSVAPDPIRPSMDEQIQNPRSKSAKLRWAIKN